MLARYLSSSPSSLCFSLLLVLSVHRMCSQPFLILLLHRVARSLSVSKGGHPNSWHRGTFPPRPSPPPPPPPPSPSPSLPPSLPPHSLSLPSNPPLSQVPCVLFNATGNKIEVNIHDNSSLGKSVSPPTQSPFRVGEGVATSIMLWATFITRPPQSRR